MRILILVLLFAMATVPAGAQESVALAAHLDDLEATTVRLRGLLPMEDVARAFPTRADLVAYLDDALGTELTPEYVARAMRFFTIFDFLPAETDLVQTYLDLYEDQVAGFYDTDTQTMNVIRMGGALSDDRLPLLDRIIFVHEYTHALQDQHFGLDALMEGLGDDTDAQLARVALVEGDASLVMNNYTIEETERDPIGAMVELMSGAAQAGNLTLPEGTPQILGASLLWPYEAGAVFVEALYREGGWEAVNAAYANPPASTEHIYHPERYLAGDMPVVVELPDQADALGEGWALADRDTMGEFYIRQFIGQHYPVREEIARAGEGWGGDTLAVYTGPDGVLAWALQTVWDTPADRDEFALTLDAALQAWLGDAGPDGCRANDERAVCTASIGEDGVLLVGAPAREMAQALLPG
jgi:hypothetical protein